MRIRSEKEWAWKQGNMTETRQYLLSIKVGIWHLDFIYANQYNGKYD